MLFFFQFAVFNYQKFSQSYFCGQNSVGSSGPTSHHLFGLNCKFCIVELAACISYLNITLSNIRAPILNVNMANTFSARVIMLIRMVVPIYIYWTSLLHRMGCTAPKCWSEYSTCLFNILYSMLLRYIFLFEGLGPPYPSWLGCTANFIFFIK